jgi:diguanylate cyclase (GGDEF)-like protein
VRAPEPAGGSDALATRAARDLATLTRTAAAVLLADDAGALRPAASSAGDAATRDALQRRLRAVPPGLVAVVAPPAGPAAVVGNRDAVLLLLEDPEEHEARTALLLPLRVERRLLGVALLLPPADRGPVPADVAAGAERVAGWVGEALRAALDVPAGASTDGALRARARQHAAVAELGHMALSGTRPDRLMRHAASLVASALDVAGVAFYAVQDDAVRLRASAGRVQAPRTVPAEEQRDGQAAFTLAAKASVVSADLDAETRFAPDPALLDAGMTSGASVPVIGGEGTHGVLVALDVVPGRFAPDDVAFLESVANVVATAIERRRAEDEMRRTALHDALTGLPNRILLGDRLDRALAAAAREGDHVGLLLLDLDGFKDVNDSLGHDVGDTVLAAVAERLRETLRGADTIARLGGDEFAVCLPVLRDRDRALRVAEKVLAAIGNAAPLVGLDVPLSASIGVVVAPEHGTDPRLLMQYADVAMYRAKRARTGVALYDPDLDGPQHQRLAMLAELRTALDDGEFELHYQPVVDLDSGIVGEVEALLRWRHPSRGLLLPGEFLPLAEQTGLLGRLSSWTIERAVAQLAAWRAAGLRVRLSVNVATSSLVAPDLVGVLRRQVAAAGVAAEALAVEVQESALADADVRDSIVRLAATRVSITLDRFGSGATLAHLTTMPIRQLKVDRDLVGRLRNGERDEAVLRTLLDLGRSLDLEVVAQGVEDVETVRVLAELGAPAGQGFYFAPPMPPDELERYVRDHRATGE